MRQGRQPLQANEIKTRSVAYDVLATAMTNRGWAKSVDLPALGPARGLKLVMAPALEQDIARHDEVLD